jgi:hypothetical protein
MRHGFSGIISTVLLVSTLGLPSITLAKSAAKAKPSPANASQTQAPVKDVPKVTLGDGFISQNTLRIYLDAPVAISVFNTRGQLVYHLDSQQKMVLVPLQGIPTGFLYLTLRSGQNELTKKLVYTGK